MLDIDCYFILVVWSAWSIFFLCFLVIAIVANMYITCVYVCACMCVYVCVCLCVCVFHNTQTVCCFWEDLKTWQPGGILMSLWGSQCCLLRLGHTCFSSPQSPNSKVQSHLPQTFLLLSSSLELTTLLMYSAYLSSPCRKMHL